MYYCTECGQRTSESANYCSNCGSSTFSKRKAENYGFNLQKPKDIWGFVLFIAPILIGIYIYIASRYFFSLSFYKLFFCVPALTAILIWVDISWIAIEDDESRWKYDPVGITLGVILLWCIFYPRYMYKREQFTEHTNYYGSLSLLSVLLFFALSFMGLFSIPGIDGLGEYILDRNEPISKTEPLKSKIQLVKGGILDMEKTLTVSEAFDNYNYFDNTSWREFTDESGRNMVVFEGNFNINSLNDMDNRVVSCSMLVTFAVHKDNKKFHIWEIEYAGQNHYKTCIYSLSGNELKYIIDNDIYSPIKLIYNNDVNANAFCESGC